MYEPKKAPFTFWHGLGLGLIIAILSGLIVGGLAGSANRDIAKYRADLDLERERIRVLKESIGGLENNLAIERRANKDIRRDYSNFVDLVDSTIEHVNSSQGNAIEKLRGVIEALKIVSAEIRDIRRFVID